jgi:NhaP-type Na+/H+ or K+/H+ antiporter
VFCELAHWSGIIASLYSGVLINTLIQPNLTPEAQHSCAAVFKLLSALSETIIFLLIGFSVVTVGPDAVVAGPFVAWTILLCLLGRAANIFPLAALVNVFRPPAERIPWQHQVVQWHAGSRGAIAFAIALTFPSQNRDSIVVCTGSVIIFTVFAFGGTTPFMIRRLGIKTGDDPSQEELESAMHRSRLQGCVQCFDARLADVLWGRSAHVKNTAKLLRNTMMERHMALHWVRIHRSGKLHSIRRKTVPPQVMGARLRSVSRAAMAHEAAKAAADAMAAGLGDSAGSSPNHEHSHVRIPKRSVALVGSNAPSSPRVGAGAHRSPALKETGTHSQSPHREQPAPTDGLPTTSVQIPQQLPKVLV